MKSIAPQPLYLRFMNVKDGGGGHIRVTFVCLTRGGGADRAEAAKFGGTELEDYTRRRCGDSLSVSGGSLVQEEKTSNGWNLVPARAASKDLWPSTTAGNKTLICTLYVRVE